MSAISVIRRDLRAVQAIVESGADLPDWALNAIWRWFFDQELRVPLPVMTMTEEERQSLALDILAEMDERFTALEKLSETMPSEERDDLNDTEDGQKVNSLWRELAGCYASIVNESVVVLSEEEAQEAYTHIIPVLIATSGITEDELLERIRYDGSTRMMLRRSGIDPDRLLGDMG